VQKWRTAPRTQRDPEPEPRRYPFDRDRLEPDPLYAQLQRDELARPLTWCRASRSLTETELLILGIALLVAGYETSAHQITNMVYTLLTQPEQLDMLSADPELAPDTVEEILRYIALGSAINARVAMVNVQLGELLIRAGEPGLTANAGAVN
jgi:cytochrome P450